MPNTSLDSSARYAAVNTGVPYTQITTYWQVASVLLMWGYLRTLTSEYITFVVDAINV